MLLHTDPENKIKSPKSVKYNALHLTITAMFTAMTVVLCYFNIPVPGGHLYFVDVPIVLAAILLNPIEAFIVGGIGSFLGDVFFYPPPMFVSLVTHGLQAIIISLISKHFLKKMPKLSASIASVIGAIVMVIGYTIGRTFFYGSKSFEIALVKLPFEILQAAVGVVVALVICYPMGIHKLFGKMLKPKM